MYAKKLTKPVARNEICESGIGRYIKFFVIDNMRKLYKSVN